MTLLESRVALKRALLTVIGLLVTMLSAAEVTHSVMLQGTTVLDTIPSPVDEFLRDFLSVQDLHPLHRAPLHSRRQEGLWHHCTGHLCATAASICGARRGGLGAFEQLHANSIDAAAGPQHRQLPRPDQRPDDAFFTSRACARLRRASA